MAFIIQIDTASPVASVSLAKDGIVLSFTENKVLNEHAAFLQPAIKNILAENNILLSQVDAIAVVNGPGSYTGLRVGLASAKGLAFALGKPLITIGTLPLMAHAAASAEKKEDIFYAPMIDARRLEVFTAVYNSSCKEILTAQSMLLTNDSFVEQLLQNKILFFGNGAQKFEAICNHNNASFSVDYSTVQSFAHLSFQAFTENIFADLAYCEPQYLKEFYTGS